MVEEAVEKKPLRRPRVVVVELYPVLTVNGKPEEVMVIGEEPRTLNVEQVVPPEQVTEVVAVEPKLLPPVQYVRWPVVGVEVVENWLEMVIEEPRATDPPPERPVPAFTVTLELVRPALVRVPLTVGVKVRLPDPGTMV